MKLHLGCGRTRMDGYLNIDLAETPGVTDLVCDIDGPDLAKRLEPDSVSESLVVHVLEHLRHPLEFMQALWTVTEPGGRALFEVPYGTSDDAWEDPTHVRPYTLGSWGYFGQPHHWRANYSYAADWRVVGVELFVDEQQWKDYPDDPVLDAVRSMRNVVTVMRAELEAVKPARPAERELQEPLRLSVIRVPSC